MAKDYMDERIEYLFRGILTLKTMEDCRAFFEDICTVKEISEMSRRLDAARMLDDNKIYNEIADATGLSTATISRVNRCLQYGAGGYNKAFERLRKQDTPDEKTDGEEK